MSTDYGNWKLPSRLIDLSQSKSWPQVLREWRLDHIEHLGAGEDSETCLCTHPNIREVCHIVNKKNQKTTVVGNCCVKKFEGETAFKGTHKIFDALKRIKRDRSASANKALIKYAYNRDILNERDYQFYQDIRRKRKLSESQEQYKVNLNKKIIQHLSQRVRTVAARSLPEALNDLRANPTKLADQRLIEAAHSKGILNDTGYEFYKSLWERKVRNLSEKQQSWMNDLNRRMLQQLVL